MFRKFLGGLSQVIFVLSIAACTSMNPRTEDRPKAPRNSGETDSIATLPGMEVSTETLPTEVSQNVRMAQAQVFSDTDEMIKGTLNFEQMPNSVIVTYRLEGLTPKRDYQISVKEQQDCRSADLAAGTPLKDLRASKQGISENTFKIEDFSVSGKQPLIGKSVVVTPRGASADRSHSAMACGQVLPLVPTSETVQ